MVLLSLKTLGQLLRENNLQHAWVLQHVSIAYRRILRHMRQIKQVENVRFAKSAALISNTDYMWHWLCPILCAKKIKNKEQINTDDSTVDLTAPQCCLVHWEGIKRLQAVAMEGILEEVIFFFLQWCSKLAQLLFRRRTRWEVEEERAACLPDTPKYGDRAFKRGEYLIKAQSRSP